MSQRERSQMRKTEKKQDRKKVASSTDKGQRWELKGETNDAEVPDAFPLETTGPCCCSGHLALDVLLPVLPVPLSSLRPPMFNCMSSPSMRVRVHVLLSAYLISYFFTYACPSLSRKYAPCSTHARESSHARSPVSEMSRLAGWLVAPDDAASRHAAQPRTMLDRIILAPWISMLRPFYNGRKTFVTTTTERMEL